MILNPLTLVLSAVLSAPASAAAVCHMSTYESGPKGLKTAQTPIATCGDVEKLPQSDQDLFVQTRKAINDLPNDATKIPSILQRGVKFLTKGEITFLKTICANNAINDPDADPTQNGCPFQG